MLALHSSIGSNVLYYAYSKFEHASQVSTASILASIVGGVLKLPIGKILTLWGRAEGLIIFTAVYILGIIILASCNNPNSYAAGYVLYWVGYDAIYIILDIFIADTSGLRNRAFAFAFASTPFICTSFTGPLAAKHFLDHSGWRWAYGSFAIIMPFVFLPLAGVFKYYENKARKLGVLQRPVSGRTTMQSIVHYLHEFDSEHMFPSLYSTNH
jgi:MFS family permease